MAGWTDETLRAYVAGIFDGEGNIGFNRSTIKRDGTPGRVVRASIYNTSESLLRFIQGHFGGTMHVRGPRGRLGKKPMWTLVWHAHSAKGLLISLLPYLRLKKRQAILALIVIIIRREQGFNRWADKSWEPIIAGRFKLLNAVGG